MGIILSVRYIWGHISEETPSYEVLKTIENFEIRKVHKHLIACVEEEDNKAFFKLAKYIGVIGKPQNQSQTSISMTAPVLAQEKIAMTSPVLAQNNTLSFTLPQKYNLENVPTPTDPSVFIKEAPETIYAVYKFNGTYDMKTIEPKLQELTKSLEKHEIQKDGPFYLARYNPPITISYFKTNEIWQPIKY